MKCPTHGTPMPTTRTRYGLRYGCEVEGCTVVCWNGETSTPADAETRTLRHECHAAFDPLWQKPRGIHTRFQSRGDAYRWLRRVMETSKTTNHIGMFSAEQCRTLLEKLQALQVTA